LLEQSRTAPNHIAWFASIYRGDNFCRAGNSICIIFWEPEDGPVVEAIVARVLRTEQLRSPEADAPVRRFFADWQDRLTNWWPLAGDRPNKEHPDIALVTFKSLAEIPGHSWETRKPAPEVFVGQNCVSGWAFDESFDTLAWVQLHAARSRLGA